MRKTGIRIHKISIGLLIIILLALVSWSSRQAIRSRELSTQAFVGIESTSTSPAENIRTVIDMPAFAISPSDFTDGIPRLAMLDTVIPDRPSFDITTYEVQPGDNLFMIAEKYSLHPETVLWGNYEVLRDNPQFLQPGQVLTILPIDGVYYQFADGDALATIADFFRVDSEVILEYPGNRLITDLFDPTPKEIKPGMWLIIPGGKRDLKDWGPPVITRENPAAAAYYGVGYCGQVYEGSIGIGAFIWPTVASRISGYDYSPSLHPGLDIAGPEGNAVFAADSGVVVFAGWSQYGYGYLIVLDHGNGWQSAYAHLSAVNVGCGQSVLRGNVIGAVGNTGNSTGAHLHFELRNEIFGKVNPWDFVSP